MQRKASKSTRLANAKEKRFMGWTKERPCICCGNDPYHTIVHHIWGATEKANHRGNHALIGHWSILPLCDNCDQMHTLGSKRGFEAMFGPQELMLAKHLAQYTDHVLEHSPDNSEVNLPDPEQYEAIQDRVLEVKRRMEPKN